MIIERLIVEERTARRKKWKGLGIFRLPAHYSAGAFGQLIAHNLARAFKEHEKIEFVALAYDTQWRGQHCHVLLSPYIELVDTLANDLQRIALEMQQPDFDRAEAKLRYVRRLELEVGDFSYSGEVGLERGFNCLRLRCDSRTKSASVNSFEARSTRPQDYPDRIETTSELLEYAAALLNSELIVDAGDPFWITRYSWIKFMTRFMEDKGIDLGRIRVNESDPEEWDFVNTELDYELNRAAGDG